MPGILEINAVEYYANESEDNIEAGLVKDLVATPIEPEENLHSLISGPGFIKPKITYEFVYNSKDAAEWVVENAHKMPIEMKVYGNTIKIKWLKTFSGQFTLKCRNHTKTVVVESLF